MASGRVSTGVDLVTGQQLKEVYLDKGQDDKEFQRLNKGNPNLPSQEWFERNLYVPVLTNPQDDGTTQLRYSYQDPGETRPQTKVFLVKSEGLLEVKAEAKEGKDDILDLWDFSEKSLLHTLRVRYLKEQVYTFVGPILISINPYRWYPDTYSDKCMDKYHLSERGKLPPHLFEVADAAYVAFLNEGSKEPANQSIIISGESGAGKTEAMKIIMQYLARITHHRLGSTSHRTTSGGGRMSPAPSESTSSGVTFESPHKDRCPRTTVGALEDKVLATNPVLEAFGNAVTLMNDNSSRFGKYVRIQFGHSGSIVGAQITNYLLEKTRIVRQAPGERNYHIFYQLLHGAPDTLLQELRLEDLDPSTLVYLSCVENKNHQIDEKDFQVTISSLEAAGLDSPAQRLLFNVIAAVLHLGNVSFRLEEANEGGEQVVVMADESSSVRLNDAAVLLGVQAEDLARALTTKVIDVQGTVYESAHSIVGAEDRRDALAKTLYTGAFEWLVARLNESIAANTKHVWGFMGVLDIYGFENFEVNSLEQLLINYANEKLQQHFNQHMLDIEQREYMQEHIEWEFMDFTDNIDTVNMIEKNIIGALNEQVQIGRHRNEGKKSQNQQLWTNLTSSLGTNPKFIKPRIGNSHFGVLHYAGTVMYNVDNFFEKASNNMDDNVRDLLAKSDSNIVRDIFEKQAALELATAQQKGRRQSFGGGGGAGSQSNKLKISVAEQFKTSLIELMTMLDSTSPSYIRCIKPNDKKEERNFHGRRILDQLRNSGMLDAVKIRQQGFDLREDHAVLLRHYGLLAPQCTNVVELVKALSMMLAADEKDWQIGITKLFLKRGLSERLHRLLKIRCRAAARTCQRAWREYKRRRAAHVIVDFSTFRYTRLKQIRFIKRVCFIQKYCRGFLERARHRRLMKAIRTINWHVNSYHLRRKFLATYNPFTAWSEDRLIMHVLEMEEHIKKNADDLHATGQIEMAMRALKQVQATGGCPFASREELEDQLSELTEVVNSLATKKEYQECDRQQKRIEELSMYRASLPTVEEVREQLASLQAQVDERSAARDFTACEEIANRMRILEFKHKELLSKPSRSGRSIRRRKKTFARRVELEEVLNEVRQEMHEAIKAKDYSLCLGEGGLMEEYRSLESMKANLPTSKEVESQIALLDKEVEQAAAAKKFSECKSLTEKIKQLEARRDALREEEKDAAGSSMADLDARIGQLEARLVQAQEKKAYSECQAISQEIEKAVELKKSMPSLEEVEMELAQTEQQLSDAKANHDTTVCDLINMKLDYLRQEQAAMRAYKGLPPASSLTTTPGQEGQEEETASITTAKVSLPAESPQTPMIIVDTPIKIRPAPSPGGVSSSKCVLDLKPPKPLIAPSSIKVVELANLMKQQNVTAALLTSKDGSLEGILTDTDVTRKVLVNGKSLETTRAKEVMTRNPRTVSADSDFVEALTTMSQGHFRHLPVVNEGGNVVGMLDVAQCLKDAVERLQRLAAKKRKEANKTGQGGASMNNLQIMLAMMQALQGGGSLTGGGMPAVTGANHNVQHDDMIPTLRQLVRECAQAAKVPSSMDVLSAANEMSSSRKASLVMDQGQLRGVITYHDILVGVVAAGKDPVDTTVSQVFSSSVPSLTGDKTILEALILMKDRHIQDLPVVDERSPSQILGLVSVMDLVQSLTHLGGEGGKVFWASTIGADDDWETASDLTATSAGARSVSTSREVTSSSSHGKSVSSLRPPKAVVMPSSQSVWQVATVMAQRRAAAVLLTAGDGRLEGILSEVDVTRRLIAQDRSPEETKASEIMTSNPTTVREDEDSLEALTSMVEGHFRHLPVVQLDGSISGMLDIARCLHTAVSRLERLEEKKKRDAMKEQQEVGGLGKPDARAAALLSQVMSGANPNAVAELMGLLTSVQKGGGGEGQHLLPTLRDLLRQSSQAPLVSPLCDMTSVAKEMSASKKSALVVQNEKVVGVVTFQDIVKRLVAPQRKPSSTKAEDIMTENPVSLDADHSILEALYQMKNGRFLNLPVVEPGSGRALGLVSVMDLVQSLCRLGGDDSGRSFWSSTMAGGDEGWESGSDAGSVASHQSSVARGLGVAREGAEAEEPVVVRKVKNLRPSAPLVVPKSITIIELVKAMLQKRVASALLTGRHGNLEGIITDTDLARRVLACGKKAEETTGEEVMTANPKTVGAEEDCLEALTCMVLGHFRHLPVVNEGGDVVGVLDIARCLDDAIGRIERLEMKKMKTQAGAGNNMELMNALMTQASKGGGMQNPALLMEFVKLFQGSQGGGAKALPTVHEILSQCQVPSTPLDPSVSVREVAEAMDKRKKAVVIADDKGHLVGIVSFKDMMSRVIAKGLLPEATAAKDIMTTFPTSIEGEKTLLDALHEMRNARVLNLPVVDTMTNQVVGVLSVMDVVQALTRLGGNGEDGGRAFWASTMGTGEDGDAWESGSHTGSVRSGLSYEGSRTGGMGIARVKIPTKRLVKDLGFAKALAVNGTATVLEAAKLMEREGMDAVLVTERRELAGILTDNDIVRRVVGNFKSTSETLVQGVMTQSPDCVKDDQDSLEALSLMVRHRYRHLPVLSADGSVMGLLDIAKLLKEALTRLERKLKKEHSRKSSSLSGVDSTGQPLTQEALMLQVMSLLMRQGQETDAALPTVGDLLEAQGAAVPTVKSTANVTSTAETMKDARKAVLVMEDGELVGIFTPKDMMRRVVAKGKAPDFTEVSTVMTKDPMTLPPDTMVLDALKEMLQRGYLHMPVKDGPRVLGLIDVMDVVGFIMADGGREFWQEAGAHDDSASEVSSVVTSSRNPRGSVSRQRTSSVSGAARHDVDEDDDLLESASVLQARQQHRPVMRADSVLGSRLGSELEGEHMYHFKFADPRSGLAKRIKSSAYSIVALKADISRALGVMMETAGDLYLTYQDETGDVCALDSDGELVTALEMFDRQKQRTIPLKVHFKPPTKGLDPQLVMVGAGTAVALLGMVMFFVMRGSNRSSSRFQ